MSTVYPEEWSDAAVNAAIAATRHAYGPRPGALDYIADDPALWLIEQLEDTSLPEPLRDLPSSAQILAEEEAAAAAGGGILRRHRQQTRVRLREEAARHILPAVNGERGFRERLVRFWSEFFAVTTRDPAIAPYAFAFEREVIRPNLTGRFHDMLLAAMRHPAMLIKYGQSAAVAKRSPAGRDRRETVVLDMARAVLEDYTIGAVKLPAAGGGFRETDVRALAEMLTGWKLGRRPAAERTVAPAKGLPTPPETFRFDPDVHSERVKRFLDRNYPPAGVLEAEAAFDTLSRMPAVGYRLAREMARHVIADDPPDAVIEALVEGYSSYGGSLGGMAGALASAAACYNPSLRKAKRPDDLVISLYRALDLRPVDGRAVLRDIAMLGLGAKDYRHPNGHPTSADHWLAPSRFAERLDWTAGAASRGLRAGGGTLARVRPGDGPDGVLRLAFDVLGARLTAGSFRRLSAALDAEEAVALLFASPEFQAR